MKQSPEERLKFSEKAKENLQKAKEERDAVFARLRAPGSVPPVNKETDARVADRPGDEGEAGGGNQ